MRCNDRCINIIGFNSKEWLVANMGAILAGGVPAGIYATSLASVSAVIQILCVCEGGEIEGVNNRRRTGYLSDNEMPLMAWISLP